ncbi:MAG: ankyrin repeat domain-containing protein [Alphaproteobacteria bacterium]|nr:ankyrin repeat domain-containing protein [Alphaproteobacteria bacterium]
MRDDKEKTCTASLNAQLKGLMNYTWGMNFAQCLELVRQGADIDCGAANGVTLLMRAARSGEANVLKDIIDAGARLDVKEDAGCTAIHYAVYGDSPQCIDTLVAAGADVNQGDMNNYTPLMSAARYSPPDVVTKLLECGAQTDIKDVDGLTALIKGCLRINNIKVLLAHGADMDVRTHEGLSFEDYLDGADPSYIASLAALFQQERAHRTTKAFQDASAKGTSTSRRIIRKRMGAGYHAK